MPTRLSSRERMLAALECREADHVPCCFGSFNILLNQCANQAEFLVEGRREGTHRVDFDISGDLYVPALGKTVAMTGAAAGVVQVRNPTFSIGLAHPKVVREGEEYAVFATVAILTFLMQWGAFLWPLMVTTSEDVRPLPLAIATFHALPPLAWGDIFAFGVMMVAPIVVVFLLFQRWFVRGLVSTGVKG